MNDHSRSCRLQLLLLCLLGFAVGLCCCLRRLLALHSGSGRGLSSFLSPCTLSNLRRLVHGSTGRILGLALGVSLRARCSNHRAWDHRSKSASKMASCILSHVTGLPRAARRRPAPSRETPTKQAPPTPAFTCKGRENPQIAAAKSLRLGANVIFFSAAASCHCHTGHINQSLSLSHWTGQSRLARLLLKHRGNLLWCDILAMRTTHS